MPIVERDAWRMQYFNDISCPDDVFVPTEDPDAYHLYPAHRWIYNKLLVAESQQLACGPHGILPKSYPVFSKPIYNLRGMGMETRVFRDETDYLSARDPGHMWSELLTGEHLSSDVAVEKGEAKWWRHVCGQPGPHQTFDYWEILADQRPALENRSAKWVRKHFSNYTGMMNLETIGGTIIEGHLRFADQWPDLYGDNWLDAVVRLYQDGHWSFDEKLRQVGFSVVLFGAHGVRHRHPSTQLVERLLEEPSISSIQITFDQDERQSLAAMPPGGFRLAIVNSFSLEAGFSAREALAHELLRTRELVPHRRGRK